jgi:hypothetical protein
MMMEKIGPSVGKVMAEVKFPGSHAFATRIFIKGIKLLMRLHDEYGIVHGDIHGGNIAFQKDENMTLINLIHNTTLPPLTFLDFGLSSFFPVEIGSSEIVPKYMDMNPKFLSHYQLENFRTGRRDDLIRWFETYCQWIIPEITALIEQARIEDSRDRYPSRVLFIKKNLDFFSDNFFQYTIDKSGGENVTISYNGSGSLLGLLSQHSPPDEVRRVQKYFRDIHSYLRGLSGPSRMIHVDSRPDYMYLIQQSEELLKVFDKYLI